MEILNKNRRNRAFWRVALMGLLVVSLMSATTFKIYESYKDQGKDALRECQENCEIRVRTLESESADKTVIINRLRAEIAEYKKAANAGPDEAQKIMEARLKAKDDEIESLVRRSEQFERSLNNCKAQLAAQSNF